MIDLLEVVVYFDADGVHADYEGGIEAEGFVIDRAIKHELNRSNSKNPLKHKMYQHIKGTDFYYKLPILPGAIELYQRCAKYDPIILTAAPKFGATEDDYFLNPYWLGAAYQKRRWFEEILLPRVFPIFLGEDNAGPPYKYPTRIPMKDEHFVCTTSARKQEFMHRRKGKHQVLFDDRELNCLNWAKAGGFAILYTTAEDAIKALDWYEAEGHKAMPSEGGLVWGLNYSLRKPVPEHVSLITPDDEF